MKFKQNVALALAALALTATQFVAAQTLLNASYDVSREFYKYDQGRRDLSGGVDALRSGPYQE
jgi:ABC-type sulfate transport system substrate-binding protein